jgi:hypothetical protein
MTGELTLEGAERVGAARGKRANEIGRPREAVTAVGFEKETRELTPLAQPGAPLYAGAAAF